jgi:hypothetical protein
VRIALILDALHKPISWQMDTSNAVTVTSLVIFKCARPIVVVI